MLLGDNRGELGGSEYLALLHDTVAGAAAAARSRRARRALQRLVVRAIRDGLIESAHDCAEGGLAVTLAECCFDTALGVTRRRRERGRRAGGISRQRDAVWRIGVAHRGVGARGDIWAAARRGARRRRAGAGDRHDRRRSHHACRGRHDASIDVAAADAEAIWATAIERREWSEGRQVGRLGNRRTAG